MSDYYSQNFLEPCWIGGVLCGTTHTKRDVIKISMYSTIRVIYENRINASYLQMPPKNIFQVEKTYVYRKLKVRPLFTN